LKEATSQFDELCEKLAIPAETSIGAKLTQLRGIPSQTILETMMKLKTPSFRAVLDNEMISENVFDWIYSGELAKRFKARGMKLLIGEVEHEEAVYAIAAPTITANLMPGLLNYYPSSVASALVDHYTGAHPDVERMYTGIVTDVQVRATTRAFSKALVDGGVPISDVLRYRVSLPIKAEDENFPPALADKFKGKVPHAFDFLHWWYVLFIIY
jgi:carboxylesterase type B